MTTSSSNLSFPGLTGESRKALDARFRLAGMTAKQQWRFKECQFNYETLNTQGLTYKEVGAKLFLTEHTIKYHMSEVIERLHLENRRQVRMMGIEVLLECSEGRFHLNAQGAGFRSGESISDALRV